MVSDKQKVSLICTVLNEGPAIQKLLDSLVSQTRRPDEIIVVDGGSTDDTVAVLRGYAEAQQLPLRVIVAPGANISRGRNIAIEAAAGPVIASTDAGVRLDARWLERLITPFEQASPPQVVSGFFVPDPQSTFEAAMGATVLPLVTDIDPATFLPSSRSVAFLKSSWAAAGRYPEWLDYCEDLIFDFRLADECGPFGFEPEAVVYFRPRSTLGAFFKQYYRYARGDGKADLYRKRHAIRYATYLAALPGLAILGWRWSRWWWLVGGVIGFMGLFLTPYRRLTLAWSSLSARQKALAALWVPIIRITGDLAKMIGYPVGLKWRWERLSSRPELRWRLANGKKEIADS
ncbi:MAG: glycosyltransferase [Anaerolineales bacterium]|nr:glycosyltransferase [Anaerolineales bacterium]